eukprot:TRINITY_DN4463_c0_g1_i1.p1 TRINITY_DN4463_c0_g1~~TRINITY_DN4463_c0_g1_i1.p1  ORF type:complete len:198 (-),score=41.01 TRINITY_DN4463_c0_g1_i1:49-642(-)
MLAAHFASHVYLTDYIPQLLENLTYNVNLNSTAYTKCIADGDKQDNTTEWNAFMSFDISPHTSVAYLNWDEIDLPDAPTKTDIDPQHLIPVTTCSILMGSELTYSTHSIHTLSKVVQKYLAPDGVFYEILSDDRDGVAEFLALIEEVGFTVARHPVPEMYLGNYHTKQRPETYHFYTFRRKHTCNDSCSCRRFPDMK